MIVNIDILTIEYRQYLKVSLELGNNPVLISKGLWKGSLLHRPYILSYGTQSARKWLWDDCRWEIFYSYVEWDSIDADNP